MNVVTFFFIALVWGASAADHYTTYLMLAEPIPGWEVWEANPIARWLFDTFGLVPGLIIDSVFTIGIGIWGLRTRMVIEEWKIVWCIVVFFATWYAVWNNINVLYETGVWS